MNEILISDLLIVHMNLNLLNDVLIFQIYPWLSYYGGLQANTVIKMQVCLADIIKL